MHVFGVSQLLAGRHDDAVQSLLAASREQPANARYLSDLAAVQLERARLGLRPDDLPRALAAADRARRLDPSLKEAWFNRALAVSALSLTDQARIAWTDYLKHDSTSLWAAEARARLEDLAGPTPAAAWTAMQGRLEQSIDAATADAATRAHTTEARNFTEQSLVQWADAVLSGQSGSAELDRARVMAEAMLRVTGDSLYVDAIAAINRLDAPSTRSFAGTHKAYAQAAALFSLDQFGEAGTLLNNVRGPLENAGSPFAVMASVLQGALTYLNAGYADADRVLRAANSTAAARGYGYAAGRAASLRGFVAIAEGRLTDAQIFYDDALATFDQMNDVEQRAATHNLLAALNFALGDTAAEWRYRQLAFAGIQTLRSPRLRHSVLASAAISLRGDSPETALVMLDSVVAEAKASGRPALIVDALAQRAATLRDLGRHGEASASLVEARANVARIDGVTFRNLIELPVLAAESDFTRTTNPRQAAASAQRAIDTIVTRGDRSRLPPFQLRLARAEIASGRLDAAERALAAGIEAFDAHRARLSAENSLSAHDEAWQLFETALQLAIRRGDRERAFVMAERARTRSLSEQRRATTFVSLAEAQRLTRPDEAFVLLNQFDDELAVWVIRHDGVNVTIHPIDRVDARLLVARQQEEIRLAASRPVAGGALFDALVRPLRAHLHGVTRITVVPDATYQDMSVAALWDRSRSHYLIEDFQVTILPSISALRASAIDRPAAKPAGSALIMASNRQDNTAASVANAYEHAILVSGADATRARFEAGAAASEVVHLAVATQSSTAYPSLSHVLLHDEPGRKYSGTVLASDIASRPLPATRLVVLDEVRTEQTYRTAGTLSVARAFLTAGVPAVLGTRPGADESETRELIVGFHRELAGQVSASEALTRVQRNALQQNGRRLGAWTALVLYGSDR
jgi:tetratricopeptide (TPR) repeat protein